MQAHTDIPHKMSAGFHKSVQSFATDFSAAENPAVFSVRFVKWKSANPAIHSIFHANAVFIKKAFQNGMFSSFLCNNTSSAIRMTSIRTVGKNKRQLAMPVASRHANGIPPPVSFFWLICLSLLFLV